AVMVTAVVAVEMVVALEAVAVAAAAALAAVAMVVDDIAWSRDMYRAWEELRMQNHWRVTFTWRGRGFLLKAPEMARQHLRLA
ncbi:MAG: hypothetical protein ACPHZB_04425, partial [Flavobacteriales bacterium]